MKKNTMSILAEVEGVFYDDRVIAVEECDHTEERFVVHDFWISAIPAEMTSF